MNERNLHIPPERPKLTLEDFNKAVAPHNINRSKYPFLLVAKRDHYDNLVGGKQNNRNFYDDALMLHIINKDGSQLFKTFNWNTDPSAFRNATSDKKGMATLCKDLYFSHRLGWHKNKYLCLRQEVAPVNVTRDGQTGIDRGLHGINLHSGGIFNTHSEGCQTAPPPQFDDLMATVLAYWGLDFYALFKDNLNPTKQERANFDAILNSNPEMRQMVFPYLLY